MADAAAENIFDLVVIGSGPGGYTGAIRAAQLGLKVAVIEKDGSLGGTCLNVGCIPSKALLDSSEHFSMAKHDFDDLGIKVGSVELDLPKMMARKDKIVKDLTGGIGFLFKKNKIQSINGFGQLSGKQDGMNRVQVQLAGGSTQTVLAKNIMLATGSTPIELPTARFDGQRIVSSTEALALPSVPQHMIVIGGGVIGLELGSVWLRLGAKVTVIEFAPMIAGATDQSIAKLLLRSLTKQGMEFKLSTKVLRAETRPDGVEVFFESNQDQTPGSIKGDIVLVSVGRRPFTDGLGLESVGVEKDERGRVKIDSHYRTNVAGIYAIGDVVAGPMLAHKAEEEGVAVAEIIATGHGHVNYDAVPNVIYTWPELASVGVTEEQVKQNNIPHKIGTFPFSVNGRAKAMNSTDGQVKIIAHAETDRVLGVHILGPRASDMIAEAVVAMEFGASSEDIARSFHAHPTLAEVMREAALAVDKRARQI